MQQHFDSERQYHSTGGYVYTPCLALELDAIWEGVDAAENVGVSLEQIGRALSHNWSAAVVALALRNTATLRALIDEA